MWTPRSAGNGPTANPSFRRSRRRASSGGDVIVGLGTNGPITDADFDDMMAILGGASRVVFVNVHVDRPWQDPNNAVLANGATRYPNVVVADWATLAAQNPQWFGADGTHLAIDGPGADALAPWSPRRCPTGDPDRPGAGGVASNVLQPGLRGL